MATTMVIVGLGLAGSALALRTLARASGPLAKQMEKTIAELGTADYKYYRGGFEPKMTKREAGLILGVGPSTSQKKFRAAHRRIMLLNHPDRGGSPYLAAKINQAKDMLEQTSK
ncbi:mitochondrial import inner membrane translocase subunit TIM14-like [Clavelina lepadiformis]|uniref:J domain-containing protein n=1 Tax=Clavelina lepadiformis TaxID=159417 RepID=A0ABP0GQ29_CLALP